MNYSSPNDYSKSEIQFHVESISSQGESNQDVGYERSNCGGRN
jgi:hypothetical protein